jgi:hypothetical protein
VIYGHVDGSVLLIFSCSDLLVLFFVCRDARVLWLLWQVGVAQWWARGVGRDLGACPVSSSRGLRMLGPMRALVSSSGSILVLLPLCLKLENFIIYVSLCNSRIHVITLYSGHVCVYYASMLWCWHLVWNLVRTDHSCIGVGCHSWYQSQMSIIRHWWPYFRKPTVRICFNAHIRTILVLTGGKLTGIYFLYLLSAIYFSIKYPHARWCGFHPCCLKARFAWGNPYHAVGADVHHATSHDRIPRASRDLGMSCRYFHKTWIRLYDICSVVHTTLNVWAPLGG